MSVGSEVKNCNDLGVVGECECEFECEGDGEDEIGGECEGEGEGECESRESRVESPG